MGDPSRDLRMGAAAVLFDERGRVLLIKENYRRRRYGLPGGAIEAGETPQEAAVREALEEVSLRVRVDHLVGMYHLLGGEDPDLLLFAFRCEAEGGTPTPAPGDPAEIAEVGWYDPSDLPSPTTYAAPPAIADARAGIRGAVRTIRRGEPR